MTIAPADARALDQRRAAILRLAVPLMMTSGLQSLLNLTDAWYAGRLSTEAVAALGANYFLTLIALVGIGGIGLGVQVAVAQAHGAGDGAAGVLAVRSALYGTSLLVPVFLTLAWAGGALFQPFGLEPEVEALADAYWSARMLGAPAVVASTAIVGYWMGCGRADLVIKLSGLAFVVNVVLNEALAIRFGWGLEGTAWATSAASAVMAAAGWRLIRRSRSARDWRRPSRGTIAAAFGLGAHIGLAVAADLAGFAFFQLVVTDLSTTDAAATQIVLALTSIGFWPMIGLGDAGSTLVGQAVGSGDKAAAAAVGASVLRLGVGIMAAFTLLLLVVGPAAAAAMSGGDHAVAEAAVPLLFVAATFQTFDALNLCGGGLLRGAGDVRYPARLVLIWSWLVFVPLTHTLTFTAAEAWVPGLPQAGWGALGSWTAAALYTTGLGVFILQRWRSRRWAENNVAGVLTAAATAQATAPVPLTISE